MKKNILFLAFAAALSLVSCSKVKNDVVMGGLDASKPTPALFAYDEEGSSATNVCVSWNGVAAISAGATSFTVQITRDIAEQNIKNGANYAIVKVVPETDEYNYTFKALATGSMYFVRIRANYDGFMYSNWQYLVDGPNYGVQVGKGVVEMALNAPEELALEAKGTSITATWKAGLADSYVYEYKKSAEQTWIVCEPTTETSAVIKPLEYNTEYDFRVKAVFGGKSSEYATASAKTLEEVKIDYNMSSPDQFVNFINIVAADATSADVFTLESDIDLSGKNIKSIEMFEGTLDGKGHSIKGLKAPLFAKLNGNVSNLVIDASCKYEGSYANFGFIALENNGKISNVTNNADIVMATDGPEATDLVAAGGIAAVSKGVIDGCTNNGNIALTSASHFYGMGVGGIAGVSYDATNNCTNNGAIALSGKFVMDRSKFDDVSTYPTAGGIVGLAFPGSSAAGCKNFGTLTVKFTAFETELNANKNNHQYGGIVGSPAGAIKNCENNGKIDITFSHSTPGTTISGSGHEFKVHIGGIGGGDNLHTSGSGTFSYTSYTNCVNNGDINFFSDGAQANSTVGGIVGWPGQEKPNPGTAVDGCTNNGNITVDGTAKVRAGGIEGGTGVVKNSTNNGKITIKGAAKASCVGSLVAFHSQGHAIENCKAFGELNVIVEIGLIDSSGKYSGGVGGLIGNLGNVAHNTGDGCEVNCKITTASTEDFTGAVVGLFNGTTASTLGGTTAIKVTGTTINGAPVTASQITGSANASSHTINFVL